MGFYSTKRPRQMKHSGKIRFRAILSPDLKKLGATMEAHFAKELTDLKPVWQRIAEPLRRHLAKNMLATSGPKGEPFPALSPRYAARKLKQGYGGQMFVRTGKTIGHLGNDSSVISMTKKSLAIGWRASEFPHVPSLVFGYRSGGRSRMPTRMFMGFTPAMEELINSAIKEHIAVTIARAERAASAAESREALLGLAA